MQPIINAEKPVKTELETLKESFNMLQHEHMAVIVDFDKTIKLRDEIKAALYKENTANIKLSAENSKLEERIALLEKTLEFIIDTVQ